MSTYLERLQEIEAIETRRREAAASVALAKRILDNKTCPCAFCVQRRETDRPSNFPPLDTPA